MLINFLTIYYKKKINLREIQLSELDIERIKKNEVKDRDLIYIALLKYFYTKNSLYFIQFLKFEKIFKNEKSMRKNSFYKNS